MVSSPLTIVVTGASRGLGLGIAQYFLERGHRVAVCARTTPSIPNAESRKDLISESVDVCDAKAVESFVGRVVAKHGDIDLFINNAGILEPIKALRDTNLEDFELNLKINLGGVFNGSKSFINHVRSRSDGTRFGTLVNISSGAAINGYAGWASYCASKAGVDRLTECALLEEQDLGRLRAYSIAPGVIDTDMQRMIRASSEQDFPMKAKFIEMKEKEQFNTPPFIAQKILEFALQDGPQTQPVVQRLPSEK